MQEAINDMVHAIILLPIKSQAMKNNEGEYVLIGNDKLVKELGLCNKENDARVFEFYLQEAVVEQVASQKQGKQTVWPSEIKEAG